MFKMKAVCLGVVLSMILWFFAWPAGAGAAAGADDDSIFWDLLDAAFLISDGTILGAQSGVRLSGFDVLALPDRPVRLQARLHSARSFDAIEGAQIGFFRDNRLLDTALTDDEGYAAITWQPPGGGAYHLTAQILLAPPQTDKPAMIAALPASLTVWVSDPNTPLAVIDLDHTLYDAPFQDVLLGKGKAMADSVAVMQQLARNYTIIYLTQRPDFLILNSRRWLAENNYPAGILLTSTVGQALRGSGRYKTDRLAPIAQEFKNLKIGVGDKISDAAVYRKYHMTAFLLPHISAGDADDAEDLRDWARAIRRLEAAPSLHVIASWRQIPAVLEQQQSFPPAAYAETLEARAAALESREPQK